MATDELQAERQVAFAARSSDPTRALRDELLAVASIAAGVAGASTNAIARGKITKLDKYALEQAIDYFGRRADDIQQGKSISSMAAMSAAREIATLRSPELRRRDGALIVKLYRDLRDKLVILCNEPQRSDIAHEFQAFFAGVAEAARAEARGLVYDNMESEETGR